MSLKRMSLGSVTAAANGITVTGATNATPIVITLGAGHGLKDGDRIQITGITGNTNANGKWTLSNVGATTATLVGSSGNGAFGGTASVGVLCDRTPFMQGHSAVVKFGNTPGQAVFVGTVVVEGSNDDGATWASALMSGQQAIPAATAGIGTEVEVKLFQAMRMRASAYTSGGCNGSILA